MCAENKKDILKMAMIYTQEGRWDKAIGEYKKLLTLDPTDYNIHNMLGDVYAKKEEDALAYQAYILAGEAYAKQGLADKAAIIYKKIGKLNADKLPEADRQKAMLIKRNTIADKLIEEGQIDKAIDEYKEILKINPANFDTYQKLGELYSQKGDQKEALNYYKKIVDVYFKNRLYKKALPIYQKILELQPDSIATREKIAEIYEREGNESDAKREYLYLCEYYWNERNMEKTDYFSQKAIDFKSIEAHFFKGAALAMKKEYGEAKKELEMLLKFKANHAGALLCMAEIQKETNALDDAIATLNKLTKGDPENTDGYMMLGEMYLKKNMKKEAAVRFLSAVSVFNKKHEPEKSAELLTKVLEQDPDNIEILQKHSEILSQLGKKKEASNDFLKISELYKKENMADKTQEFYKLAQDMDPGNSTIVDNAKKMGAAPAQTAAQSAPVKAQAPPMDTVKPAPSMDTVKPASAAKPLPAVETVKAATPVENIKPQQPAEPPKQDAQQSGSIKIQRNMFYDMSDAPAISQVQQPAPQPKQRQEAPVFESLPDLGDISFDAPAAQPLPNKPAPPVTPPVQKKPVMEPLPEFDPSSRKKPSEQIKDMEEAMGLDTFSLPQQTREDVPSMIAMADSLVKTGSYDEAIEMYQKAISIDPNNDNIKNKLNAAYSQYAGVPIVDPAVREAERKRKEEIEKSAREQELRRHNELEEARKKIEEEKKKKEQEIMDAKSAAAKETQAKEAAAREAAAKDAQKKKEEEEHRKSDEARKKKEEEESRAKEAEAKKKKPEEEKKAKTEVKAEQPAEEPEISDDFVTVTTAEIFMKQGLLTEAEKILNKILRKDGDNMEARMRLNELKKLITEFAEEDKKPAGGDEDKGPKGSKVSYI